MIFADDPKLGTICRAKEDWDILQEKWSNIEYRSKASGLRFSVQGLGLVPRNKEFSNREEERLECSNGSRDVSSHFMTVKKEIEILSVPQKSSFKERHGRENFLVQGCASRTWDRIHQLWSCIKRKGMCRLQ